MHDRSAGHVANAQSPRASQNAWTARRKPQDLDLLVRPALCTRDCTITSFVYYVMPVWLLDLISPIGVGQKYAYRARESLPQDALPPKHRIGVRFPFQSGEARIRSAVNRRRRESKRVSYCAELQA